MTDCTLCELPTGSTPVTDGPVDGAFCCRGCLEVYRSLGDVNPAAAEEELAEPTTDTAAVPDDAETAYLTVDGMHCSTCEVFLESVARESDGVFDADASYAAETVKLTYDPETRARNDLPDLLSGLGYRARERGTDADEETDAQSRLLVGGIFGMMAMTWYAVFLYPTYFGYDPIVEFGTFDGLYLYGQIAILTAIVLLYTGRPMLRGAYVSVRMRRPNVDLLVTVAALAAFLYSTGRLLVGGTDLYYDVTIVVVMAVTIGNYYEERIKRRAAGLLADLTELQVEEATLTDGETVPVDALQSGDRLRVRPGERIPVDGTVVEGTAAVDESLVTGESLPETKQPGDAVRGGTVVTNAPLVVEAGEDATSTLDRVVELFWDIQASRPGAQRVADRLATVFVPLVLSLAAGVALFLLVTGAPLQTAVLTGLTVLIVSCPCALGLATPLAIASGLQTAADRGLVVATPALFEDAGDVDVLVFDKTGTLTTGEMTVLDVEGTHSPGQLLARAAAVETYTDHPIASAVTAAADDAAGVPDERPTADVESVSDYDRGIAGTVEGRDVLVGHPDLYQELGWTVPGDVESRVATGVDSGAIPVVVGWDGVASGVLTAGDAERENWAAVAAAFDDCETVVLTGDDSQRAERLRDHAAVDTVFTGVPPDGKVETVRRLAATGTVAMVGDGSNDAPALAAADVGIALDSGTQLATDAADAVVLDGDLSSIPDLFAVAAGTNRRIRENLAWAFAYNAVAIPLAISGLLNPLLAAVAMAGSSLLVVLNSARSTDEETASAAPAPTTHHTAPELDRELPSD